MFRVIYLWRGERRVAASNCSRDEADTVLETLVEDKWIAWIEYVYTDI